MKRLCPVLVISAICFGFVGIANAEKKEKAPVTKAAKAAKKASAKAKWVITHVKDTGKKGKRVSPTWVLAARQGKNKLTIVYARPSKRMRTIFGGLVPFDKVWRTGANEATTIELSQDVTLGGKKVKAGKYALFTIPGKKQWTIILNKQAKQWGAYNYKKALDVVRFQAKPSALKKVKEMFTIIISQDKGQPVLHILWDTTKVSFPIGA